MENKPASITIDFEKYPKLYNVIQSIIAHSLLPEDHIIITLISDGIASEVNRHEENQTIINLKEETPFDSEKQKLVIECVRWNETEHGLICPVGGHFSWRDLQTWGRTKVTVERED